VKPKIKTIDFGAPEGFGVHLFRVEIPESRNLPVKIIEDYGYRGQENGIPKEEPRVVLNRATWLAIADYARQEFNNRLKKERVSTGRWHSGVNRVDRLLGKELCVLAWAAETAQPEELPVICRKWAALRPEERWWLFSITVAEAGLPEDSSRGWRRALYLALADGEKAAERKRRPRPVENDQYDLPLFKESE